MSALDEMNQRYGRNSLMLSSARFKRE
ncbi:DUF4113 domain-containing protein [Spirosoma linguale]